MGSHFRRLSLPTWLLLAMSLRSSMLWRPLLGLLSLDTRTCPLTCRFCGEPAIQILIRSPIVLHTSHTSNRLQASTQLRAGYILLHISSTALHIHIFLRVSAGDSRYAAWILGLSVCCAVSQGWELTCWRGLDCAASLLPSQLLTEGGQAVPLLALCTQHRQSGSCTQDQMTPHMLWPAVNESSHQVPCIVQA